MFEYIKNSLSAQMWKIGWGRNLGWLLIYSIVWKRHKENPIQANGDYNLILVYYMQLCLINEQALNYNCYNPVLFHTKHLYWKKASTFCKIKTFVSVSPTVQSKPDWRWWSRNGIPAEEETCPSPKNFWNSFTKSGNVPARISRVRRLGRIQGYNDQSDKTRQL